jgi:hypothetical protein
VAILQKTFLDRSIIKKRKIENFSSSMPTTIYESEPKQIANNQWISIGSNNNCEMVVIDIDIAASIESNMEDAQSSSSSLQMVNDDAMDYCIYAGAKQEQCFQKSPESSLTVFFNDAEFTQQQQQQQQCCCCYKKKSVVFQTDESGQIVPHVWIYDQEGSREDLYYSESQILSFKLRAKQCGKAIRDRYRGEVALMESLYNSSSDNNHKRLQQRDDIRIAKLWAKSYARGLEEHVTEIIRYQRRKYIASFLSYQATLLLLRQRQQQQHHPHFDETTEKEELLRAYRRQSTRQAQYFAVRIAAGDASAAR